MHGVATDFRGEDGFVGHGEAADHRKGPVRPRAVGVEAVLTVVAAPQPASGSLA
jgi:hypothetical protein